MNAFGTTSVSFQNVTIIIPPLAASISANPNPVPVNQPVSFSCVATGGTPPYAYSWTLGDGSTSTASSLSHIYSTPGAMTVVCIVTDNQSIHTSATATVIVN